MIPLQIKLVYHELKWPRLRDQQGTHRGILATTSVGLTSQYVEQFGRKLLGGLLGSVAGGLGRGLGRVARNGFLVRDYVRAR